MSLQEFQPVNGTKCYIQFVTIVSVSLDDCQALKYFLCCVYMTTNIIVYLSTQNRYFKSWPMNRLKRESLLTTQW